MLSRRKFLGGLVATGVAGCASSPFNPSDPNSTFNLVANTFKSKAPSPGDYPLTAAQIQSIPYATLGVRIDRNPRAVMVLATADGRSLQWASADYVTLVTRDGWLLQTHGLHRDLAATRWRGAGTDPLRQFAQSGVVPSPGIYREIDLGHDDEHGIVVESRFVPGRDELISIQGQEHRTVRIDEIADVPAWRLKMRNSFWVSPETGMVWRSRQQYCPEVLPIELEVLRPAAV
jgi:hypothetical protein